MAEKRRPRSVLGGGVAAKFERTTLRVETLRQSERVIRFFFFIFRI